jgi:hypothetical protein
MDPREAMDDEAALRQYTFDVGDFSRDCAAVTVRLDAAPEADVVLEWLGALRQEASAP